MDCTTRSTNSSVIRIALIVGLASEPTNSAHSQSTLAKFPPNPQVDEIFTQLIEPNSPGCAVAVIKDRNIEYANGYGMADLDHGIPITPETVFHAGSLAKQFTAMSIMLLVKQGQLSLEDDVRTFIPELPTFGTRITTGDMLRHQSGLRDQYALLTMAGWRMSDDVITRHDVLDLVKRMKSLNFKPGDQFLYSNTGYTLAGLIVQRVSGKSLSDFAQDNIFKPLGMKDTRFENTHGLIVQNRAYGYREERGQPFELRMPNYDFTGPTNLLTTVKDLALWDNSFDTDTVIGEALRKMATRTTLPGGSYSPYGLGLYLQEYENFPVIEHDGRDAGYRSHLMHFRLPQHLAVACLCNRAFPEDGLLRELVGRVAKVYLPRPSAAAPQSEILAVRAAVEARPQATVTPADIAEYIGRYYSSEIDAAYDIKLHQGLSLVVARHKYKPTALVPAFTDVFTMSHFGDPVLPSSSVRFVRDYSGHVTGFLFDGPRILNFQFTKMPAGNDLGGPR